MKKLIKRIRAHKNSILSFLFALLLMFTFNFSAISAMTKLFDFSTGAYKSDIKSSYYSSANENYVSEANMPSDMQDYLSAFFEGSSRQFSILDYYNEKFEEELSVRADNYLRQIEKDAGSSTALGTVNYPYEEFLEWQGVSNIREYYNKTSSWKSRYDTFQAFLEYFIMMDETKDSITFTHKDVNYTLSHLPSPHYVEGVSYQYDNLKDFYFGMYKMEHPTEQDYNDTDRNDGTDTGFTDISDYRLHSKSYTNFFKKMVDDSIQKDSVVYGYDNTQSRTVAGIVAKGAKASSSYYYSKDTYDTVSKPKYDVEKVTYNGNEYNKVYYFGDESGLSSGLDSSQLQEVKTCLTENRLAFLNVSEIQNNPFYYKRITASESEKGLYIPGKPTYLRYVSNTNNDRSVVPYEYTLINNKEYYNVYVEEDDNLDINNQTTIDTLKFRDAYNTISSTELAQNKDWYVQVPYFNNNLNDENLIDEEYYFAYLFNLIGYKNQDGSYFKHYCELFTKLDGSTRTSRIYLKLSPTTTRKVYIKTDKSLEDLRAELLANNDTKNYAYMENIEVITEEQAGTDEYKLATSTSSESGYLLSGYEVYFKKSRVYFSKFLADNRYGDTTKYETKYVADIKYEQNTNMPTSSFITDGTGYKIYILDDGTLGTSITIDGKSYDVVAKSTIDSVRNLYVKVPVAVQNALNNKAGSGKNYEYYYRHETKSVNQIYVYTEEDNPENNEIYKNLGYKVLTKDEYNAHKSYYCLITSEDSNYNEKLKLYYKYAFGASDVDLTTIFVQNKISGGNAVFIVDDTVNPSEFDIYNELNYTVISSEELKLNADFYVVMPDNEDTKYTTLYYKYLPKSDGHGGYETENIVYLYSNRTSTLYNTFYNTDTDFYADDYELITPEDKNYVEGINLYYKKIVVNNSTATSEDDAETRNVYYYYSTSYTTTLSADSYYAISFYVYTNGNVQASFYVNDSNNIIKDANAEHIKTDGKWQKHYIFIATDSITQSVVSLRMYMGDQTSIKGDLELTDNEVTGMVLFDNIQIIQINQTDFNKKAIDDVTVEADQSKKESEETTEPSEPNATEETTPVEPADYKDEYGNLVVVNKNNEDRTNFDYRTKSEVKLYNEKTWDEMFDFDSSNALQTLINESLSLKENTTGYTKYDELWQYYISRNASDLTLTLQQYQNAYKNENLVAEIIDEYEIFDAKVKDREEQVEEQEKQKEKDKEDSSNNDDEEEEEDDEVYYIKSTFKNDNKILKLENKNKSVSLGIVSNFFVVPQNEYYKVSLWIYAPKKNATAKISVFSVLQTEKSPNGGAENENRGYQAITTAEIEANARGYDSTLTSEYGWIPVSYYIEGNALQNCQCYLALEADANDTIYFDNISIQRITSSEYDSANSDRLTNTQTLSLTTSNSLITSSISNGNFYNITDTNYKEENDYTKPYTAESWTIQSDSSSSAVAGVVLTSQDYIESPSNFFNSYDKTVLDSNYIKNMNLFGIYSPAKIGNPLLDEDKMPKPDSQEATLSVTNKYKIYSSSVSLSANSVYKISFNFFAANGTNGFKGNLVSNLYYSSVTEKNVISSFKNAYSSDNGNLGQWHTYTYYVATGMSSCSVYLEIGIENATGVCYFQNADSVTATGTLNDLRNNLLTEESEKTQIKELEFYRFVDFSNTYFSIYGSETNELTGLHDSKDYSSSVTASSSATVGKSGVAVASFYTKSQTVAYTVTINEVTYYVYDANSDGTFELYSEDPSKAKDISKLEPVTEIGGETVQVVGTLQVIVGEDNKNAITKTTENNYKYSFDGNYTDEISGTKYVVVNDVFVPVSELDNSYSKNVLILANSLSTDYTLMSPVYSNSLSTSSYYALKIYIKTGGFESTYEDFGLNVNVSGISSSFPVIDTTKVDESKMDEDGFVCYQVLISTNTSSVSQLAVEFSLGSEKKTGKGYAIIAGVEIENFASEDAFNAYTEDMSDDDQTILRYYGTKEDEGTKTDDEKASSGSTWATFFYIFSSLLLVIVLVAAIVAVVIKKHPVKISKKEVNDHERNGEGNITTTDKKEGIVDVDKESKKQDKTTVDDSDEGFV